MQDVLLQLLQAVITVATPIVAGYAVKALNAHAEQAKAATANEMAQRWIAEVANAITTAILYTSQTYVDALKDSGDFTVDRQKQAFKLAMEQAKSLLSKDALHFLDMAYGDATAYLTSQIEAEVKTMHINTDGLAPALV